MLNVDVMDGVQLAKRRDECGEAGISENPEKCERDIDGAASRDPIDSMVAIRRTKPSIMGMSSSSAQSSLIASGDVGSMAGMTATENRGCWVASDGDAGLRVRSIEGL